MTIPQRNNASGELRIPSSMAFSRPLVLVSGAVSVCADWAGCERRVCASIGGAGAEAYIDIWAGDEIDD